MHICKHHENMQWKGCAVDDVAKTWDKKKRVSCEKNCININIYHDDEHTFIDYLYAKLIHYTVILFEYKIYIIYKKRILQHNFYKDIKDIGICEFMVLDWN